CQKHGLLLIEDCAEAVGSLYYQKHVGNLADASTFSFFGNKTITTGEGGMAVFRNSEIAERARILRDHGMSREKKYWHEIVGYNFRMTNIQAAIGVAQMEQYEKIINKKREIAGFYQKYLTDVMSLILPTELDWAINSYWLYSIIIRDCTSAQRDSIIEKLNLSGIDTRPVFYSLHTMPPYEKYHNSDDFSNSKMISSSGISLPSSIDLDEEVVHRICSEVISILKTLI
ncbi:MAG: DegT/DnrJ/EryC1/StrS family aminotransferase, partial [Bacteroidota bacterium]